MSYTHFLRLVPSWKFSGAIVYANFYEVAFGLPNRGIPAFSSFGIPYIDTAHRWGEATFPRVIQSDMAVGRMAAQALHQRGARGLAFAGCTPDFRFSHERQRAFLLEADRLGLPAQLGPPASAIPEPSQRAEYEQRMDAWVASLPDQWGILGANDNVALSVLRATEKLGRRVPHDLLVLGVDNTEDCLAGQVALSSIDTGAFTLGFVATDCLLRHLLQDEALPTILELPPAGLVERASTDVAAIRDPLLAKTIRRLRQELRTPWTDLAGNNALQRRSLERRFRKVLGTSPAAFVQQLRLDRARQLLLSTTWTVGRIVGEIGLNDEKWFMRWFRRETGVTPGQYRAQAGLAIPAPAAVTKAEAED